MNLRLDTRSFVTSTLLAALAALPACSAAPESEAAASSRSQSADSEKSSTDPALGGVITAEGGAETLVEDIGVRATQLGAAAVDDCADLGSPAADSEEAPSSPAVDEAEEPEAPAGEVDPEEPVATPTITTNGRQILDSCGNPLVVRGVEQIFGNQLPQGNDWLGLIEQIADSGVNAVRILAGTDTLTVDDVDTLISAVGARNMVAYVTPYGNEAMAWLGHSEVREMLARHERYIIIDAFGEPTFDDRERFLNDSTDAIRQVRAWGYRVPLTVTANQFGRDLPSLFELGPQIVAADPLNNTILGWQAYWGRSGYYQGTYGYSLTEAVEAVAAAPFPIQLGLDHVTDPPNETADFESLLSATEANGISWLWWDWYNPYGPDNNLSVDGSNERLTATGQTVVNTHAASVQNTSVLTCSR